MTGKTTLGRGFPLPVYTNVPNLTESPGDEAPAYLDQHNRPRDRFYRPVKKLNFDADAPEYQKQNPITHVKIPLIYHIQTDPAPFPEPADFRNRPDYVRAVKTWGEKLQLRMSSTFSPVPVTGEFFVPSGPKIFKAEEKTDPGRMRTFKPAIWPLFPANYMEMLKIIFTKRDVDPDKKFPHQVPKRDPILYKHHITSQKQWQSQMFTHEPVPELYDSYEEFELSYKNWQSVVLDEIMTPVMEPKHFATLLGLNLVKESTDADQTSSKKVHDQGHWASALKPPKNMKRVMKWCRHASKLIQKKKPKFKAPKLDVLMVTGLTDTPEQFVSDMTNYGDNFKHDLGKPERPIAFLRRSEKSMLHELMYETVLNADTYDLPSLMQLMECELDSSQLDKLMTKKLNGKAFANILTDPENSHIWKNLVPIADRSMDFAYRVSVFMDSIFYYDQSCKLDEVWNPQGDLFRFRQLVVLLSFKHDARTRILPILKSSVPRVDSINLVYFLSMFLEVMQKYHGARYYLDAMEKTREIAYALATDLKDPNFLTAVRGNQNALTMLLSCNSRQIHRVLLGDDFLVWLNELSQKKFGVSILQTIIHGPALQSAVVMFTQGGYKHVKDIAATMTLSTSSLIQAICNTICYASHVLPVKVQGEKILTAFDACIEAVSLVTMRAALSLGRVLLNEKIITNFSDPGLFELMSEAIGKFCANVSAVNIEVYTLQMRLLAAFACDHRCAMTLVKSENFVSVVTRCLDHLNTIITTETWNVLDKLSGADLAIKALIDNKDFGNALVQVPIKLVEADKYQATGQVARYRWAFLRFLHLSTLILELSTETSTIYGDMIVPCIGSIVRLYKGRSLLFVEDPVMEHRLEEFVSFCTESLQGNEKLSRLHAKFRKYLEQSQSGSLSDKKRAVRSH